jgi:hypothetical protein
MGRIANIVGKIFTVPLKDDGYSVGLIARQNNNIALGYFFNNYFSECPKDTNECLIERNNICLISLFGILGIKNREWKIIGNLSGFDKKDWEIPEFKTKDLLLDNVYWKIIYNDELNEINRIKIKEAEAKKIWNGGIRGYGLIETILNKKIPNK